VRLKQLLRMTRLLPGFFASAVLTLAGLSAVDASADPAKPEPFVATYAASYRGIGAGKLTFTLKPAAGAGQFVYETTADPSFLARLVVSGAAIERSTLHIDEQGVRPLHWMLDDGKSSDADDGVLTFDWQDNVVSGVVEREAIELPTQPGLQDRLSIQLSVMTSLMRGTEPGTIPLIDDNRIKHYTYTKTGEAVIDTALGSVETVIYESTRKGSSRVARFWMAPKFGYLPLRAEQKRKGKVETVMVIEALEQTP